MKNPFQPGDQKFFSHLVTADDAPHFPGGVVHPVYATYALGRDAEWAARLFVLEMKDDTEEGIGTYLHITHHAPAFPGEVVRFCATLKEVDGHRVDCDFVARVGDRLVASGSTGQKILKKDKLESLFKNMR